MLLLIKPKRTNSNFSSQDFSKAKLICRTSFQQYKQKFHYEPDWNSINSNLNIITSYSKKKKSQAQKIVSSAHSYSVHSYRNIHSLHKQPSTHTSRKQRPSTAKVLLKKPIIKEQPQTSKNISDLFQNQHLSSTLQITQSASNKNQTLHTQYTNWRPSSQSFNRTSISSKKFIFKTKITDLSEDTHQQKQNISKEESSQNINTILGKKENYYNPYNIGPSLLNIKSIKPIKTLRNQSIRQLKQLCKQERNMNFHDKLAQKENKSATKCQKIQQKDQEIKDVAKNQKRNVTESQDILKSSKLREAKLEKKTRNRIFSKIRDFKKASQAKNSYFPLDHFGKFVK